jgi:hypothetical protein
MPNYTKLFNSIVTSTIWTEDDKTRIVWITMLALADQNGEVHASIPGLARLAGVPVADAESAILKFLSPDPYSRTPANEGRRISAIDGGWELLNHAKYRRMASLADQKDANAKRQKRHRERNAAVTDSNATVTPRNVEVTVETDKAEAEAEVIKKKKPVAPAPVLPFSSGAFCEAWEDWLAYNAEKRKKLPPTTISAQLKKLAAFGEKKAIASIEASISNNWQGLFRPKDEPLTSDMPGFSRPISEKTPVRAYD